jgi:hypothetical protein
MKRTNLPYPPSARGRKSPTRSALQFSLTLACALSLAACGGGDDNNGIGLGPGQGPSGGQGPDGGSQTPAALTLSMKVDGRGDVESLDAKLACGPRCSADYPAGSKVTLNATPAQGFVFNGWGGACGGTEACVVTMDAAQNIAVKFSPADPTVPTGTWLKGDTHVHDDHSSDGSAARQLNDDKGPGNTGIADQIGQATRMGLQFMPLTDHRTYDQHYDWNWESSSLLLLRGEEANGSPHATVQGGVDSIVQGAARADRQPFTHLQQSIWDAHSQDANWIVAHPNDGETNDDGSFNAFANVQGMDLVEIWNGTPDVNTPLATAYAETLWNAGFRFGAAGASDSHMRELWDGEGTVYPISNPGMPATSVLSKGFTERAVIHALQLGHTTLSYDPNGPFVDLSTDLRGGGYTAMGGDEVFVPAGTAGHLRIDVRRSAGLDVFLYRMPGKSAGPFKSFKPKTDDESYIVDITSSDKPDWYRVEVRGLSTPQPWAPKAVDEVKAAVSPIFVSPAAVEAKPGTPAPTDQGIEDNALRVAGARNAFAGFPDIATDAGALHYVAELHGAASSTVVYRHRDDQGAWRDEGQTLSGKGQARYPRVAARGNDVWVTWEEDTVQVPHRPLIELRHSADGGATWEATRTVRSIEGRVEHPEIALAKNGKPVLVWQEISAQKAFDIMAQEIGTDAQPRNLSGAGKATDPGTPDDTRTPRYPASVLPSVAVAADGRVAVAWQDDRTDKDPLWTGAASYGEGTNPDDWQIQVLMRDAGGVWSTEPLNIGTPDRADRHPDIVFGGNGELVAAWESKELSSPAGNNLSVLAAVSTDGGKSFGAPAVLGADDKTMSERPRLGVDTDGSVRAVWYDSRSADWRWRVMTAVFKKDTGWDGGMLLNGRGINTWPATSGGLIAFASTRNATRLQRDPTQQVFLLNAAKQ